jgi:hypothetical protein
VGKRAEPSIENLLQNKSLPMRISGVVITSQTSCMPEELRTMGVYTHTRKTMKTVSTGICTTDACNRHFTKDS